ncbi:MAG: HEAT repeat domain-containing protein [Planctomycetes bacterium]|nr:HEAT repeat domain-containing protein [Planctomycetota bacterium]
MQLPCSRRPTRRVAAVLAAASLLLPARSLLAQTFPELDYARDQDPRLSLPAPIRVFSPKLLPLWRQALARPEIDYKRLTADTIADAHRRGMPGLDVTAERLRRLLEGDDEHRLVRLSAAKALIALDVRDAAPSLQKRAATDGPDMAQFVEPVLAEWNFRPMRAVWLKRLEDGETPRRSLLLAIRGLAAVDETRAAAHLRKLVASRETPADVRLAAADALARLEPQGLVPLAENLAADDSSAGLVDRLASARLLVRHEAEAADLLKKLAVDPEPAVATIAYRRLNELGAQLALPLVEETLVRPDANLRRLAAETLVALPSPEHVARLAPVLDDPHPDVRKYVRGSLIELAKDAALHESVLAAADSVLEGESWRGLEQASHVLVALDHKPSAPRLAEVLDHPRPEAFVTAAWGLRKLAVEEVLPAMLQRADKTSGMLLEVNDRAFPWNEYSAQVEHLFEAFGQQKHAQAEPLMRRYIPKEVTFSPDARAAAIWALGHLHAGRPDEELAALLVGRLSDTLSMPPETEPVRRASAIALGRMHAESALAALRRFHREEGDSLVGQACAWAITQMTGERFPPLKPIRAYQGGWFLMPLEGP